MPSSPSQSDLKRLLNDPAPEAVDTPDPNSETTEGSGHRQQLELINDAMTAMAQERDVGKVSRILLNSSVKLVRAKWGWVSRLSQSTGHLEVTAKLGTFDRPPSLRYLEGIGWKAMIDREPQLADNVQSDLWKEGYVELTSDTRSELAMPLVLSSVLVREGNRTKLRSRATGVMTLGSPDESAFSATHVSCLLPLIRLAALLMDRLEVEQKAAGLREVERQVIGRLNWREVVETVVQGIKATLGFDWINISLVDSVKNIVRSEVVVGISQEEIERYKKVAGYSLDGKDIQAEVVRTKRIEVVRQHEPRLDHDEVSQFKDPDSIRVVMPIIAPSSGDVIGTVEAGYQRSYENFISERDIGALLSFIGYAAEAIEPTRLAFLETVSHELRSSIVGIRSNTEYLKFLGKGALSDLMTTKLNDILADSEILLLNVGELEYFMGRTAPAARIEETWVVRDILIKTVNQLKPLVRARRFDPKKIEYPRAESGRIRIHVEKAKLNQVVYNLLLNSIKYADDSPERFSIQLSVSERQGYFVIKFVDWGIGIRPGLERMVFDYGFRSPEARAMNVSGSGLGLTIAKARMKEMGGDLLLTNNHRPTEFQMLIPKRLREAP